MKIVKKYNFRVVVEPKSLGDFGSVRTSDSMFYKTQEAREKAYRERCESMIDQIKRHVDDVRDVTMDYDVEESCSHCKLSWEVDENGVPVCCDAAIAEYETSKAVAK